jgi:hypothetical protein
MVYKKYNFPHFTIHFMLFRICSLANFFCAGLRENQVARCLPPVRQGWQDHWAWGEAGCWARWRRCMFPNFLSSPFIRYCTLLYFLMISCSFFSRIEWFAKCLSFIAHQRPPCWPAPQIPCWMGRCCHWDRYYFCFCFFFSFFLVLSFPFAINANVELEFVEGIHRYVEANKHHW